MNALCDSLQLRWVIRRDMDEMLEIERGSFEFPWNETDFVDALRQRNIIGIVAEAASEIRGFMIYELRKHELEIIKFAVHPEMRRQLIGTTMLRRLKDKLSIQRRKELVLKIRESNLPGQLFFRQAGFEASGVLRQWYCDGQSEDAYVMRFCPYAGIKSQNQSVRD